ncbi:nuclear transport factor 2 family protein [Streptomyces buecherae]|uniref:nuclear transport factor 2 family protein n=1 Tax=Streptomyces buecherae TaxID=2763006 RepID=UPI0034068320
MSQTVTPTTPATSSQGLDYEAAVNRYFAAWNAPDPAERERAVAAAWSQGGSYTDPLCDVSGHAQIAAVIAGAREQFAGYTFQGTGLVDGHHHIVRFAWELVSEADGSAPVAGFDVMTLDEDGRARAVLGFLDRAPAV